MKDLIVLVPGAGIGGADLLPMAWQLQRRGYRVKVFFCITWFQPLAHSARQLHDWLSQHPEPVIHLVGYSLGGLVILHCLEEHGWAKAGRVVTVGTPHTNIAIARQLMRVPGGRWVVGEGPVSALPLLPINVPAGREIGAIAGNQDWGTGALLALPRPNDSIISVDEAHHPATPHRVLLPVSHTGMLFSDSVATEVDTFLREGQFTVRHDERLPALWPVSGRQAD
jgi:pimeloyl-ACP methyl ester carboxylesterase